MSYLLCQWLKEHVKMAESVEPADLDDSFSNGYLYGELLEKLSIQESHGYIKGQHTDILTNNYSKLEQVLRQKLGITLTLSDSIGLISGKPGSAAKLLYQIKSAVASRPTKRISKSMHRSVPYESYPSSPISIHSYNGRWRT